MSKSKLRHIAISVDDPFDVTAGGWPGSKKD